MAQGRARTMEEKIAIANAKVAARQTLKEQVAVAPVVEQTPMVREEFQRANPEGTRRKRGAFNGTTSKLSIGYTIPGFFLYFFNDVPGRIDEALQTGYLFVAPEEVGCAVDPDSPEKVRRLVGTDTSGKGLFAYLMKQRLDWHEEDQAELQEQNDIVDAAIRGGRNSQDPTGFYVPKAGINYKTR